MRKRVVFLGLIFFFALTLPASAQVFGSARSNTTGSSIPTSIPSFFTAPLSKPNFLGMSQKPSMPQPLNLTNMMPSWSHLQNTLLLRNVFSGPQAAVQMPSQAAPPTAKKRMALFP